MKERDVNIKRIQRVYFNKTLVNDDVCLYIEQKSEISRQPYRIKNLLCYFCVSGEVTLLINGERTHIQAPAFVTYFPESLIEEESISPDFRCAIIAIDKPLLLTLPIPELPEILFYVANHPVIPLQNVSEELLLHAWQSLFSIAEVESPYRHQCIAHLIAMAVYHPHSLLPQMLSNKNKQEEAPNTERDGQLVNRCIELINQYCTSERFVGYYAKQLNVTPSVLNMAFRKWIGCSVTDYIHRMIMRRAAVLLIASRATINEIANTLGFKAPGHFVTFFKKNKGITPERYRYEKSYWISPEL